MAEQFEGRVDVVNSDGVTTIALDADGPALHVGGSAHNGALYIYPSSARRTDDATIRLNGARASIAVGNVGEAGDVYVRDAEGHNVIHLIGGTANLALGGNHQDGDIVVKNGDGLDTVHIDGQRGRVTARTARLGTDDEAGHLYLRDAEGHDVIHLSGGTANLTLGGDQQDGDIVIKNREGVETIHLDGQSGDIILANADCAEDFEVSDPEVLEPGMVVVIAERSRLERCVLPYDKRVAGVLAGAKGARPGIILGRAQLDKNRLPVAMVGTAYCKVDAQFGRIDAGDLLTTSSTPGHAMKASDPARAFGAVIGKAMQPLEEGQGLIPVLVALH
jgi:hypothetical protein